jgi:TPR repeat protein
MELAETGLALSYLKGEGVERSPFEACAWLTLAAPKWSQAKNQLEAITAKASPEALALIKKRTSELESVRQIAGAYYPADDAYASATPPIGALMHAAAEGDPIAQVRLAYVYEKGQGVALDLEAAIQWYRRVQRDAPMELHTWLGIAYATGVGVPQDYELARKWLFDAANEGSSVALRMFGELDRDGKGADPSLVNAYMWLSLAESDPEAARELDEITAKMKPEEIQQARILAGDWRLKHPPVSR